jgi:hypothetical protein
MAFNDRELISATLEIGEIQGKVKGTKHPTHVTVNIHLDLCSELQMLGQDVEHSSCNDGGRPRWTQQWLLSKSWNGLA